MVVSPWVCDSMPPQISLESTTLPLEACGSFFFYLMGKLVVNLV